MKQLSNQTLNKEYKTTKKIACKKTLYFVFPFLKKKLNRDREVKLFSLLREPIVFISVILFLSSCDQTKYHNIPKEMKPLLVNNDTVCFLNSVNNSVDTFCIHISHNYEVSDKIYYWEYFAISYAIVNKPASFKRFLISQGVGGGGISVDGNSYRDIQLDTNLSEIAKINLNIRGVIYPTVYVLEPYFSSMPDYLPNTIYYTFQHGIIRYDYSDGRHYEIINK